MKSKHGIYLPIIAVLIIIIFFLRECSGSKCQDPDVIVETRTVIVPGDSIPYEVKVEIPVPYKVEVVREIPSNVDTLAILQDYFSSYFYTDTITDDTSITVVIYDRISQNKIVERFATFQNLREKKVVINKIINKKRVKIYAGLSIGGNSNTMNFGPSGLLQTKKDHIYGYHYDLSQKTHNFSLYFKLNLRKHETN